MQNLNHVPFLNKPFWQDANARFAHVIVDVQKEYCRYTPPKGLFEKIINLNQPIVSTKNTHAVAENIARITPEFRDLCDKTYVLYMDREHEGIDNAWGGIDFITVEEDDVVIQKTDNDGFTSCVPENSLEQQLRQDGITHILLSGGKIHACAKDTAQSAIRKGFEVAAMMDCLYAGGYDDCMFEEYLGDLTGTDAETGATIELTDSDLARYQLSQRKVAIPTQSNTRQRLANTGFAYKSV